MSRMPLARPTADFSNGQRYLDDPGLWPSISEATLSGNVSMKHDQTPGESLMVSAVNGRGRLEKLIEAVTAQCASRSDYATGR